MCGILGGNLFKNEKTVWDTLEVISHRGTDNSSIKSFPNNFYLAHNRLSIQDLSIKSNQPFQSIDGRYHLVFNGELWERNSQIQAGADIVNRDFFGSLSAGRYKY